MEFPAEDIQPFGSSGLEINDFKINTDNTIFKFLSSSLYSNKIRAIIRELSCNAYDAHIEAGKPNERFLVKLPTLIDPVFKIRDYGTGLSHEDIQNVYTTYLSSTKRNNNDLVGCYGLGSKSPFSYTSMFTVRSYYCGRVSTYQFFAKQGEGVKWTLVSSVSCDEPAGLEVEIEVNKQDISEWVYEAQHVFRPFEIKPEVTGNRGYVDDPYRIRYEGNGWMIVDEIRRHDRGPIALMGNIEYPLQDQHSWSYLVNNLLSNKNLVVRFPLGSFTMNPGRELIEWTPTAIRSIGEFLENVVEDINKQLNSRVLVAKTLFEARKLYLEYVDEFGEDVIQPAFWNGVALTRSSSIPRHVKFHLIESAHKGGKVISTAKLIRPTYGRGLPVPDIFNADKFFLLDRKNSLNRVRAFIRNNSAKSVIAIEINSKRDFRSVVKCLGNSYKDYERASDIEVPRTPRAPRKPKIRDSGPAPQYHSRSICLVGPDCQKLYNHTIDLNDRGIWLKPRELDAFSIRNIRTLLSDTPRNFYVVDNRGISRVQKSNWVHISKEVNSILKSFWDNSDFKLVYSIHAETNMINGLLEGHPEVCDLLNINRNIKNIDLFDRNLLNAFSRLISVYNYDLNDSTEEIVNEHIFEKFPLLEIINYWELNHISNVIDYINMVNKTRM